MFPQLTWFGRGRSLRWAISAACSMAFILFGYDQGVLSGIVGNEHFRDTFGHPSPGLEGIIVSIYNLGALSGCIVSFLIGEKLGRRTSMWFAMVWIVSVVTRLTILDPTPCLLREIDLDVNRLSVPFCRLHRTLSLN